MPNHNIEVIVAELGGIFAENERFRREMDLLCDEVAALKSQSFNTDETLAAIRREATELRISLSKLREHVAQLRVNTAQVRISEE